MTKKKEFTLLQEEIDANLRKAYQQSLNEDLPKRFTDLIDALREGRDAPVDDASDDEADT